MHHPSSSQPLQAPGSTYIPQHNSLPSAHASLTTSGVGFGGTEAATAAAAEEEEEEEEEEDELEGGDVCTKKSQRRK